MYQFVPEALLPLPQRLIINYLFCAEIFDMSLLIILILLALCANNIVFIIQLLRSGLLTGTLTCLLTCPQLRAINFAKCRMMNSDDLLQFAESFENLSFIINSASCKIKVELHSNRILILGEFMQKEKFYQK